MIRKVHTRAGSRQKYYHETSQQNNRMSGNSIVRPPTCHPYSAYKNNKSQSQLRGKYSQTYFHDYKIQNKFRDISAQIKNHQQFQRLPPPIRHTFNQLRALFRNKSTSNKHTQSENLLELIAKNYIQMIETKTSLSKQNELCLQKISDLEQQLDKINKKSNKVENCVIRSKWNNRNKNCQQELIVQNCRLGQMNIRYLARIAELQSKKQSKIQINHNQIDQSNKYDTEVLRCQNRISYLQIKLNSAQKTQADLENKIQLLQKQLRILKQTNQEISSLNVQIRSKMNQWRQRALMQKEDGQIQISRQQFLLYSLRKLRQNNKNLLEKLLSQNSKNQSIEKNNFSQNTNFQYQMDFFKNLNTFYEKGKGQRLFSKDQVRKNELGVQIEQTLFDAQYHNYRKQDKFNVSHLKLYRPNFYAFLQQSLSTDITQCRKKDSTSVSRIFIQILRSVLNSKLNQFIYVDAVEKYTRFPEFVYAWFEKFYFNSQKKCVMMLQPFMQKPISQQNFYKDLMNVKLDQSWEIITFRQFLLQQLSLEQLYFYLLCQNLLYTRAGVTKQIQYNGDFNILVQYSAAKSVLDITLNDFQSWNITFLNSKLRQKLIIKNKKQMIQAGFFLRCLTEYYRIERSNRYRYISKLSNQFKDAKKGLRFSSFMSIINKFTQLPMEYKLKVYRDCFCITKGVITPQSIFTICNQNLIFLKYLKMKSFYRLPKIASRPMKLNHNIESYQRKEGLFHQKICLHPSDPYLYTIVIQFKKAIEDQANLLARTQSLGISELINQILFTMKALDERNSEINSNILKCKHFIHYFMDTLDKVRKINFANFYELLQEQWKKKNKNFWVQICQNELGQIFAEQIKKTFDTYHKINEIRIWKNKIYNFRVHHAARKIQRQVKKKFIEPYEQLYKYLNHQSKKSQDPVSSDYNTTPLVEN